MGGAVRCILKMHCTAGLARWGDFEGAEVQRIRPLCPTDISPKFQKRGI